MTLYKNNPLVLLVLFVYVVSVFSPVMSFFVSIFILATTKSTHIRYALLPVILLCASVIISSRELFAVSKDDFETYYDYYSVIYNSGDGTNFGFEFGFKILNEMLSFVFPKLSPGLLLFLLASIQILLLFVIVEVASKKNIISPLETNKIIALILICLPFLSFSLVIRQNLSMLIMALGLLITNAYWRYFYIALAASFHLSAIFIYSIFVCVKKISYFSWHKIILFCSLSILCIAILFPYLSSLPKIRPFFLGRVGFDFIVWLFYFKLIFLALIISFFSKQEYTILKKFLFVSLLLSLVLDNIAPYISFRILQPFLLFAGVFIYLAIKFNAFITIKKYIYFIVFMALFIFKVYFTLNPINYFSPFSAIPIYSTTPFYYINDLSEKIYRRMRD